MLSCLRKAFPILSLIFRCFYLFVIQRKWFNKNIPSLHVSADKIADRRASYQMFVFEFHSQGGCKAAKGHLSWGVRVTFGNQSSHNYSVFKTWFSNWRLKFEGWRSGRKARRTKDKRQIRYKNCHTLKQQRLAKTSQTTEISGSNSVWVYLLYGRCFLLCKNSARHSGSWKCLWVSNFLA